MPRIQVTVAPDCSCPTDGPVPDSIREQWLGCVMPILEKLVSGACIIARADAVNALREIGRDTAADYWDDPGKGNTPLVFPKECYEEVR